MKQEEKKKKSQTLTKQMSMFPEKLIMTVTKNPPKQLVVLDENLVTW